MAILKGKGTLLACQFSGATWTTVGQRIEIGGPNRKVETSDTTTLDSTSREHVPTLPDSGEFPFKVYFDPDDSTHAAMESLLATPALKNWRHTFTDATPTTYTYSGTLISFDISGVTPEGIVVADGTIKISGAITKA